MNSKKSSSKSAAKKKSASKPRKALWELRLYIAGLTPNAMAALDNLKQICEEHVGEYRLEVVDLLKKPQLAAGDQIFAVPTLVRRLPQPVKKIIGDLSNKERVVVGLDLKPARFYR